MFSRKLGYALAAVLLFLTIVAFMMGRPPHRDERIYPIVREASPFTVEQSLGGLKIRHKDDPEFKKEPDAVNFYHRLQTLEREWARKHLRLEGMTLTILDRNGSIAKRVSLRSEKEKRFVEEYYGVKAR